jgi:PIN domain nuclease of toxin-antitoxin system
LKLLVDTHTFLWLMESPEKLSERASDVCFDPTNSLYLSAASLWEIQIKSQLGKLDLGMPLSDIVEAEVTNGPFGFLPIRADHVLAVGDLPTHHNDPFDRMLIAQARSENMEFVTADGIMQQYASLVRIMW